MSRLRAPAFLLSTLFLLAFAAIEIPDSFAQSQGPAAAASEPPRAYDATKEVVISGTISEVAARPKAGLPSGMHLMLSTTEGQVDVHLGPYAGRTATQNGLIPGATIQVTGVTMHFAAGDVFLARQVVVNGQTLTIRNQNGIPVRHVGSGTRASNGASAGGL
jgi:hypothetical protein